MSQPCTQHPSVFPSDTPFFCEYPYLLPCLIGTLICAVALVFDGIFLKEPLVGRQFDFITLMTLFIFHQMCFLPAKVWIENRKKQKDAKLVSGILVHLKLFTVLPVLLEFVFSYLFTPPPQLQLERVNSLLPVVPSLSVNPSQALEEQGATETVQVNSEKSPTVRTLS